MAGKRNRTKKILRKYSRLFANKYKQMLSNSEDTGALINSVKTRVIVNDNEFGIEMTLLDYWKYIEEGRPPGKFPPVDKMIEWVERSIPSPRPIPSESNRIPTPNQLAYIIGKKISEEGTEGKHYLQLTIDEIKEQFIIDLKEALVEDIKEEILM